MNCENSKWEAFLDLVEWWECEGNFNLTSEILESMGYTTGEIIDSIHWLNAHGAFCDCEIFFNILDEEEDEC